MNMLRRTKNVSVHFNLDYVTSDFFNLKNEQLVVCLWIYVSHRKVDVNGIKHHNCLQNECVLKCYN